VTPPADLSALSNAELQQLLLQALSENAEQKRLIAKLREEVARLKGLQGRPRMKPSGMEPGPSPKPTGKRAKWRRRGKVVPRVSIEEQVVKAEVPPVRALRGMKIMWCRMWLCGHELSGIGANAG
jgi:hypothetical protein